MTQSQNASLVHLWRPVETIVLRVPGELNCLIIDELDWILGGYKMYCLHA